VDQQSRNQLISRELGKDSGFAEEFVIDVGLFANIKSRCQRLFLNDIPKLPFQTGAKAILIDKPIVGGWFATRIRRPISSIPVNCRGAISEPLTKPQGSREITRNSGDCRHNKLADCVATSEVRLMGDWG
jgi:hypothetical protein